MFRTGCFWLGKGSGLTDSVCQVLSWAVWHMIPLSRANKPVRRVISITSGMGTLKRKGEEAFCSCVAARVVAGAAPP